MSKIEWTEKQFEALKLLSDPVNKNVLLSGGARSGKTFLLLAAIIVRALKFPNSRHLVARYRFAHAKISIWLDTLIKLLRILVPAESYTMIESDHYVRFTNGSEIWIDGLDDKDRVDKILGREYATIFFNEISQIAYETVTTVLTRLSQQIKGCRPMAYYDCNPSGLLHWSYRVFVKNESPTGEALGLGYAHLSINPRDNEKNLADGYIDNILEKLPEHKKKRFLLGQWTDPEGTIFTNWDIVESIPEEVKNHSRRSYGLDFGFSVDPAALVDLYMNGDEIWADELIYDTNMNNNDLAAEMLRIIDTGIETIADSAEPKSIDEIRSRGIKIVGAQKGPDSVRAGIDWLLSKRLHVTARSINLQSELGNYKWKVDRTGRTNPEPIDDYNHAIDAIRYGCSEWMQAYSGLVAEWSLSELGL